MNELNIPYYIFIPYTVFCILFIFQYQRNQRRDVANRNKFWSNEYMFEILPSVFPTIGILCTALGIIIGLQDFNTDNIQESIPTLLKVQQQVGFTSGKNNVGEIELSEQWQY